MKRILAGRMAMIKLSIVVVAVVCCSVVVLFGSRERAAASAFGPTPGHTGAPSEANCTACHSDFDADSGSGSIEITGLPAVYTPGQTYPITVKLMQEDAVIYGFQLTAVDQNGNKAGNIEVSEAGEARMQVVTGVVGKSTVRQYVEHTSGGLSNGQFGFNSWVFDWTAPPQAAGPLELYAAGNAANSDGDTSGDYIYTTAAFTTDAAATPVSIGGRVTTPAGIPLRNTRVVLSAATGEQFFANTSSFGLYSFSNVPSGVNYTVSVQSKRYRFSPRMLTPTQSVSNIDMVGLE